MLYVLFWLVQIFVFSFFKDKYVSHVIYYYILHKYVHRSRKTLNQIYYYKQKMHIIIRHASTLKQKNT